jgi:hypothetical protein
MSEATYLPERQTEYWTSREIEEFLLDAGYSVIAIPLSQAIEHHIPSDFLYLDQQRLKIFGLQYKALYHNSHDHWKLDEQQHHDLQRFPWMYYCTSELRDMRDARSALHFARFYNPTFAYRDRLLAKHPPVTPGYRRWGAFFQAFRECRVGHKVADRQEFKNLIGQAQELRRVKSFIEQVSDLFFVNLDARTVVHAISNPMLG